jgi:TonB family protein
VVSGVKRFDQRQGFLVSATIHLILLTALLFWRPLPRTPADIDPNLLERKDLVFLPPAAVLRQLAPALPPGARPRPVPTPPSAQPTPPAAQKKDRISVGPPSDVRLKGPMILRREDDLTKAPKGQTLTAPPAPTPVAPTPAPPAEVAQKGGAPEVPGRAGLKLPPGLLGRDLPRGDEGRKASPGPLGPSIAGAADNVARRMERNAQMGIPTGTGQSIGGLYFDPQGADFTLWIQRFKDEVYRNWIMPQAAYFNFRGHVDFEFVVERNGSISALRMEKSSGTPAFDKAAQFALTSSHWDPLPDDYGPPRITMKVTFFYNEAPQGS